MLTQVIVLTRAVRAVRPGFGPHPGPVALLAGAVGLGGLVVVDLLLLTPPRPPATHIQVAVAVAAGAFGHWNHNDHEGYGGNDSITFTYFNNN